MTLLFFTSFGWICNGPPLLDHGSLLLMTDFSWIICLSSIIRHHTTRSIDKSFRDSCNRSRLLVLISYWAIEKLSCHAGSPSRRGRNDALTKVPELVGPLAEDKLETRGSRGPLCKRTNGTPMKKLIEQEMTKEMEARRKPPSIVARLMGLDALPAQQPSALAAQGDMVDCKPNRRLTGCEAVQDPRRQPKVSLGKMVTHDNQLFCPYASDRQEYKDVYEVSQQPTRSGHIRDEPFLKGRCRENPNDKRMALVRQKFVEAKRLATNQKLLQSKEFQDALEVLSSNSDLFLKFLEEPNSLFSRYLNDAQTSPLNTQTRRITVLKPSKSLDSGMQGKTRTAIPAIEASEQEGEMVGWGSTFLHKKSQSLLQPTRIVVLKPSPGKPHNTKALIASPTVSVRMPQGDDMVEDMGNDVPRDSREVAKEITRQMRESFSSRRDESLLSSVLSNGYTGDESSIYRSEDDNLEDEHANFSDSEIATPTSRHSWDCINTFDSPYSLSSFGRASCSSEPSVIREAKKRLSERWVMQTSNEMSRQQKQVWTGTSTLGEMLALTESKKAEEVDTLNSFPRGTHAGDQEINTSSSSYMLHTQISDENGGQIVPGSLRRSRSLPVSSSIYDTEEMEQEGPSCKPPSTSQSTKKKNGKSSLKGKLSSFLFLRSKKPSTEKCLPSPKTDSLDRVQSTSDNETDSSVPSHVRASSPDHDRLLVPCKATDVNELRDGTPISKMPPSIEKPKALENVSSYSGQPSPVSVLESPFEDDGNSSSSQPCQSAILDCHRAISRSPPIESVARSLRWNGAYSESTIFNSSSRNTDILRVDNEEHERVVFVQMLLSTSGLSDETSSTVLSKWHSLESPLNPALLDKIMGRKEEAAMCRVRRSNQRLIFDCVNAALLEISWNKEMDRCMYSSSCLGFQVGSPTQNLVTDEVSKRVREWFSNTEKMVFRCSDNGSRLVDCILRKELDGNGWMENAGSEIGELGREIGGQVLEELVGEALDDFIGSCMRR